MPKLLLVDDDQNLLKVLSLTLEKLGHKVTEATDGEHALQFNEREAHDAALVDLIMPNKEGIETIIGLRKQKPGMKIIAMSGGGRLSADDVLAVAKAMGANAVLSKPFTNEELVAALAAIAL